MKVKLLLLYVLLMGAFTVKAYTYRDSSKLAKGTWIKLRINETGIYKLTYDDLRQMGISHPENAKIYGYGGWRLAQIFDQSFPDDLPQVPIWRETGNNDRFDAGDYILFYGRGVVKWEYNATNGEYIHSNNPYSNYGYYFVSDNEYEDVLLIDKQEPCTKAPQYTTDTYDYYALHEKDLYNYLNSGCEFYGELFNSAAQNFVFRIPGITSDEGLLTVDMVSRVDPAYPASYVVQIDGETYIDKSFETIGGSNRYTKVRSAKQTVSWTGDKHENTNVSVQYKRSGSESARLNYIRLNCRARLALSGSYTFFRDRHSIGKVTQYQFQNTPANAVVWAVSSSNSIEEVAASSQNNRLNFRYEANDLREFVVFNPTANFAKPDVLGKVANQNLHAASYADMVIITQPDLRSQAEVLANIHRVREEMTVNIVEPEEIYNEFSSGTPDATAYRWFLRMLYQKGKGATFLLLFGDGTYDNRLLTNSSPYKSPFGFILTYQSPNSTTDYDSYTTDDYYGFLGDNEGSSLGNDVVDLCIGRIPVATLTEARGYVAKVLSYLNNEKKGIWKNSVTFWADDEDNNLHMEQADKLAQIVENNYPEFMVNKIYIDAFKQNVTAAGASYPDAKKKLLNLIDAGQLIINYTGHGSTIQLTGENMFTMQDIQSMHNDKYALWVTATCDFTRFDNDEQSAGEALLLNPQSGAIATFSTTRIVNSTPNFTLNTALINNLFQKNNGKRLRIGEVMRNTKRALGSGENKLNFSLFGDPALYVSYPEYKVRLTHFKNKEINMFSRDTLRALENIVMAGEVMTPLGTSATDFNGTIIATVFDSRDENTTLNNDGKADATMTFYERTHILYSGNAVVKDGHFEIAFTVPKDISYSYRSGMINFYAYDDRNNEAQGYYERFLVGGSNENAPIDTIGPRIAVYLNDTTFQSGGKVNETPLLLVFADDESGVNKSGNAIGHDITLTIDDNVSSPIVLNDYYENTGVDKQGSLRYLMEELEEGWHKLYFKIWDIHNNSSSVLLDFEVVKGLKPKVQNVSFIDSGENGEAMFYIQHDRPMSGTKVEIQVLDCMGKEVWRSEETLYTNDSYYAKSWDKTGFQGNKLPLGVYVYRVSISNNNSKCGVKSDKFLLTEQ